MLTPSTACQAMMKRDRISMGLALAFAISLGTAWAKNYQTVQITPAHLGGMTVNFNVILPANYEKSSRRFPVLYLLHGYTGHYSDWVEHTRIVEYAQGYAEIIVMPEGENSWYTNNVAHPELRWEDYIILDLIPYVDGHLRTLPVRASRAIAGLSMGGYGAMKLGLQYPQTFAAVASLSGVLASAQAKWYESIRDGDLKKIITDDFGPPENPSHAANDPFLLVWKVPPGEMPQLYFSIGSSDHLLQENRDFATLLARLNIRCRYCEVPGRHEWPVWDRQIRRVLAVQAPRIGATLVR